LAELRDAGIEVVDTHSPEVDLVRVLDDLAGQGLPRLLCEGGPRLHRDLLAADLVDEMSLTLAPVVVAGAGMRTTTGDGFSRPVDFELEFALLGDDGALFTNYRRTRSLGLSEG
jgi:riboflavin biosynthesis pyrimidine reductase